MEPRKAVEVDSSKGESLALLLEKPGSELMVSTKLATRRSSNISEEEIFIINISSCLIKSVKSQEMKVLYAQKQNLEP